MKLLINFPLEVYANPVEPAPNYLFVRGDTVLEQKVNLYDESTFCAMLDWLETNTDFSISDCKVFVEDCVKFLYEGRRDNT